VKGADLMCAYVHEICSLSYNSILGAHDTLVHICHIKCGPFISHLMITHLFSFQPSHMLLEAYLVHMTCGRIGTKKSYSWMKNERNKFNVCMCAPEICSC
jgi:hypothetical protein